MNEPVIAQTVLQLANNNNKQSPNTKRLLVYLGTATYDLPGPRQRQTQAFLQNKEHSQQEVTVESVDVAHGPLTDAGRALLDAADIILVSGGNTLYAVDRWKHVGLDIHLQKAVVQRGAVVTGGSAGAICWFDGGHSDSADPDSWKEAMMTTLVAAATNPQEQQQHAQTDESSAAPTSAAETKAWEYIRIQGLCFLPGLVCPHNDKIQSNGVLRATDFDQMLLRHNGEVGIGIDHWAALQVQGDVFTVVSIPDKEGSVLANGEFSPDRQGKPGIWIKRVQNGRVVCRLCPSSGKLSDILSRATEIVLDPREEDCRQQNPADF